MWIVKLGGSLTTQPELRPWLQMLAEVGGGRVTVVPGGGPFAQSVRQVQSRLHFDELTAHNMAVLGMAQMALMLHGLEPRLVLATDEADIRRALHRGAPALWAPYMALRDAPDLLSSWDVTSDSLALWLARRMNAERVLLVKTCALPADASLADLAQQGVVDTRFTEWALDAPFPIAVVDRHSLERVRAELLGVVSPAAPAAARSGIDGLLTPVRPALRDPLVRDIPMPERPTRRVDLHTAVAIRAARARRQRP